MRNLNAVLTLAYRDLLKFVREPVQMIFSFFFPALFVGVLGSSFQQNLGQAAGFNFLTYTFIGVLMQTAFSVTAETMMTLLEDRENDFTQEIFVAPVSRYAIILGKIVGGTLQIIPQFIIVSIVGLITGVPLEIGPLLATSPVLLLVCLLGGGFGIILISLFNNQRGAAQILPLIIFPLFFLGGVFSPVRDLALPLAILSHLDPLRYAVDLGRGLFYSGKPEYNLVVLESPLFNLVVVAGMTVLFILAGTYIFVRSERNK
ncbi:MAG TPA: ABC transporter permease [Chloroflexia bacterium]|nr:ABC transporter permease [Chloroflexia bacterium]